MAMMIPARPLAFAILFIATSAIYTGARGQNIYKCGNSYSQTACEGGSVITPQGGPSAADKAQRDAVTLKMANTADGLEKSRLAQEKTDRAANTRRIAPLAKPALAAPHAPGAAPEKARKPTLIRPNKPQEFTAIAPAAPAPPLKPAAK